MVEHDRLGLKGEPSGKIRQVFFATVVTCVAGAAMVRPDCTGRGRAWRKGVRGSIAGKQGSNASTQSPAQQAQKLKSQVRDLEQKERLWIAFAFALMQRECTMGEMLTDLTASELPYFLARMSEMA